MKTEKNILAVILLIACVTICAQEWVQVGTEISGNQNTLIVDGHGVPYVAYSQVSDGRISVKKYDDVAGDWVSVGPTEGFSEGNTAYSYNSIAVDRNNVPYVAYLEYGPSLPDSYQGYRNRIKKFDGNSWVDVGTISCDYYWANWLSLAFDANNTPYLGYQDGGNRDKITVKKFTGSNWVTVGPVGFSANRALYISLVIDHNNTPVVAYNDWDTSAGTSKATVQKFNGTSWVDVGNNINSADLTEDAHIAVDINDTPYLAYRNGFNSNGNIMVKKFNGTSWVNVGTIANEAYCLSFMVTEVPYVAYLAPTTGQPVVKKFTGTNWINVGIPTSSATRLSANIIDGTPYICSYNNSIVVRKFQQNNFTARPTSGYQPLTVHFTPTNVTNNPIVSWDWNFGDNTTTSTQQNPEHIYNSPGEYTVTLTTIDSHGLETVITKTNFIKVSADNPAPPQGLGINISGPNVVLSWTPVSTSMAGDSINVTGYLIYSSDQPNEGYRFLGFTESNSYSHNQAAWFNKNFFYRVTAYSGNVAQLRKVIQQDPIIRLGQLAEKMKR